MRWAALLAVIAAVPLVFLAGNSSRGDTGQAAAVRCPGGDRTGRFIEKVHIEDVQRTALVNISPAAARRGPMPLIVALHGAGGNGRFMERYSGLTPVANQRGFAVAYPDAEGRFWQLVPSGEEAHDDVTFIRTLIDQLERTTCIDPGRVYVTGVSNGGGLAARLGCELSDRVAAIAPVAGRYSVLPPCHPTRPVSILEVHGTDDAAVNYKEVPVLLAQWRSLDHCSSRVIRRRLALRTLFTRWPQCAGGSTVQHVKLFDGEHGWPQTPLGGPASDSHYDAATGVVGFFSSVPRRP
jgi:polyhydroxybutyrate depolymerase